MLGARFDRMNRGDETGGHFNARSMLPGNSVREDKIFVLHRDYLSVHLHKLELFQEADGFPVHFSCRARFAT